MRLQEFTTRAPTPEPSKALPKDVLEVPGQMTVDDCIAEAEKEANPVDLAWAGGLFDGEGCFTKRKKDNGRDGFSAHVEMCDEDSVRRFHSIVRVGRIYGPMPPSKGGINPSWRWNGYGDEGKHVGELLRPYLNERRRAKLDELLVETSHPELPPRQRNEAGQWLPREEEVATSVTQTTPSGIELFYQWAPKRLYRIRRADPSMGAREPIEVPSVTQVLNVLDKSGALTWWGQGVGVEGVLELFRRGIVYPCVATNGANLAYSERDLAATKEVVTQLLTEEKLTVNHVKDQAADRGVNVHNALEQWTESGVIPSAEDWPEHESGYVQGLAGLLEAIQGLTDGIQAEVMVGSLEYLYAGRYDLRLELKKPVEVVTKTYPKRADKVEEVPAGKYLLDLKTSKRVYDTHYLQLEAYEQASIECGYGETDHRGVVHVTADGKYELVLNKDWRFDDFQAVRHCYQVMHERKIVQALRDDFNAVNVT